MGSLFRSEEMILAQLFLQSEAAYFCVRELGELGRVQFRDLNPEVNAFLRKFINEVRRCDEMERKLRFLSNELEKAGIEIRPAQPVEAPDPQDMIDLESKFEVLEGEVKEISANRKTLKKNLLDLIELHHILSKTSSFIPEAELFSKVAPLVSSDEKKLLDADSEQDLELEHRHITSSQTKLNFLTGVINRERMATFERVLWRSCRGNVFLRQAEIEEPLEDPDTGLQEHKVVFILFFQGSQLRSRVRKICEAFRATLYQCPETAAERAEMTAAVQQRTADLRSVLEATDHHSRAQFSAIAKELDTWKTKVKKIKSIYHTMNMFNLDVTQHCLIAECWCPVEDLDAIQRALTRGTEYNGSDVPSILNCIRTDETPPTYNKVNKFTRGFQAIVDSYGIATYQEVNPALYTIITFPFLFAVMFGDAGHGLIMAAFALLLILFEKRLASTTTEGEMFGTIFNGRYIVFLMGLFSIYTGLIYNDIFSKSFNIFGSSWDAGYTEAAAGLNISSARRIGDCCPGTNTNCVILGAKAAEITIFPREAMRTRQPYPFGLDPVWNVAENKLLYTNSYKMKMAVILGIFQMTFGVILSVFNHVHFKHYINITLEFIPQVLFMLCIFGWLVFTIFFKWSYFYEDPNTAPSLLNMLINMFLEFGSSPKVTVNSTASTNTYSVFGPSVTAATAQRLFQMFLVIVAVLCIPWMLCIKPFYLLAKHKYRPKLSVSVGDLSLLDDQDSKEEKAEKEEESYTDLEEGDKHKEEFEFSEVFVYQAIHTIEYCLGTISNTASYLRLWALSLAHAELSEVLWTMEFSMAIKLGVKNPYFGILVVFLFHAAWAVLTVGILLVMEGLSAFLHALRLHWVEFQTKFYSGNGYKFKPFSFEAILKGEDEV